ncbi:MAG: PIN domain-containing protein [Bacteroidetes bacterium]|nr:PIN domain-containing protein [Bacteroidota bacterium]
MKDKFFLDTNLFIYTFNDKASDKQIKATELIELALLKDSGSISYQVIQEFVNVVSKTFQPRMAPDDISSYLKSTMFPICNVYFTKGLVDKAIKILDSLKYGWYDSLIISAALESGVSILYTEDLQNGQVIEGVEIVNPFI